MGGSGGFAISFGISGPLRVRLPLPGPNRPNAPRRPPLCRDWVVPTKAMVDSYALMRKNGGVVFTNGQHDPCEHPAGHAP